MANSEPQYSITGALYNETQHIALADLGYQNIGLKPSSPQPTLEAQDHVSQDIGPTPPSRQPTLEAQNHASRVPQLGRGLMHTIRSVLPIPATHGTKDHELDLKAANKLHPECRRFWDNYRHFRDRPYTLFQSLSPLYIMHRKQSQDVMHIVQWSPEYETCLSSWLESVHAALVVDSPDSLIIW